MATIKIDRAKVVRVFYNDTAMKIAETIHGPSGEYSAYYTVWCKGRHGMNVGDWVALTGKVSAKPGQYETDNGEVVHTADVSVNDPEFFQPASVEEVRTVAHTTDILDNAPF